MRVDPLEAARPDSPGSLVSVGAVPGSIVARHRSEPSWRRAPGRRAGLIVYGGGGRANQPAREDVAHRRAAFLDMADAATADLLSERRL